MGIAVSSERDRKQDARTPIATEPDGNSVLSGVPLERMRALTDLVLQRRAPRRLEFLAEGLDDPDVDVLFTAAELLARIGTPNSLEHLLRLALDEKSHVARRVAAVVALGGVAFVSAEVRDALRRLLGDSDAWLRSAALDAVSLHVG
jgi:HEAT repeat protein